METIPNLENDFFTQFNEKTFYGFKFDVKTGNLEIHLIDDDTMIINLPDDNIIDLDTYLYHFWSKQLLDFSINTEDSHLYMKIV
jgi:hypothetical protein